jgi:hypothetical protein
MLLIKVLVLKLDELFILMIINFRGVILNFILNNYHHLHKVMEPKISQIIWKMVKQTGFFLGIAVPTILIIIFTPPIVLIGILVGVFITVLLSVWYTITGSKVIQRFFCRKKLRFHKLSYQLITVL